MVWERSLTKHGHGTRKGESCARWSDNGLRVQRPPDAADSGQRLADFEQLFVKISPPLFLNIFGEYIYTTWHFPSPVVGFLSRLAFRCWVDYFHLRANWQH